MAIATPEWQGQSLGYRRRRRDFEEAAGVMQITGERLIPRTRARVWRLLAGQSPLQEALGPARSMRLRPDLSQPFELLAWQIGPDSTERQTALLRLEDEGSGMRLCYAVSLADLEGDDNPKAAQSALGARIEQAIGDFAGRIIAPAARARGTVADAVASRSRRYPGQDPAAASEATVIARLLTPGVVGGALFLGVVMLVLGMI